MIHSVFLFLNIKQSNRILEDHFQTSALILRILLQSQILQKCMFLKNKLQDCFTEMFL